MAIVARLDAQGAVLDFMDWRDETPLPANCRDATTGELAELSPPPTPEQIIGAIIMAGVNIVSTGTPALNGTYAIDPGAQQNISGVAAGIASRNRLPGGGSTFSYGDAVGVTHSFTAAQYLDFASAVEDYIYALANGGSPTQPLTIP